MSAFEVLSNHASWLISCPCNDMNFKNHLKAASDEDLAEALRNLPEFKNKTKIKVISAEIRRRNKNDKL